MKAARYLGGVSFRVADHTCCANYEQSESLAFQAPAKITTLLSRPSMLRRFRLGIGAVT